MKKTIKIIGIIVVVLVILWLVIFAVDFFRLKDSRELTKPLITISSEDVNNTQSYRGIGYSVTYKLRNNDDVCGLDFKVFGKFIYGWIE